MPSIYMKMPKNWIELVCGGKLIQHSGNSADKSIILIYFSVGIFSSQSFPLQKFPAKYLLARTVHSSTSFEWPVLILTLTGHIKGQQWVSSSLNFSGCCVEVVHSEYKIRLKHSAEMSGYKLFFFPGRAKGEKCRLAFAAAKIDYEDIRLPVEEWEKEKACK